MRTLGAYEIVHTIKTGGMGEVLLARKRGLEGFEQLVAVKTIRAELLAQPQAQAMFVDEARLLARLTHPAIATVFDFGEHGGERFLVMEYVPGIRFRELIDRRPPPTIAARAVAEACRGLHAAHELRDLGGALLGVVHRDISPENLMLGHDGRVKVLDFGIALVKGRATVTEHGTIKGKPPYMSPEQARGEALDRRSDVFSIGLVAHELITGQPVFTGDSLYAVARAVVDDPIDLPGSGVAGLDDAIMNALERPTALRTQTAAIFADALERAAAGESLAAWADRELAADREQHRRWLAGVLSGEPPSRRIGRASGAVTAQAPAPVPEVPRIIEPARPAVPEPEPEPPPRSRSLVFAIVLLLLGAFGLMIYGLLRPGPAAPAVAPDATVVVVVPSLDAAIPDAAPVPAPDAAPAPIDAGRTPRRVPVDAAPPPAPIDAAPAVEPAKTYGYVKLIADPFANIRIDGKGMGVTPKYKLKLPTGPHEIELSSPDSGAVRFKETVVIEDGKLTEITIP